MLAFPNPYSPGRVGSLSFEFDATGAINKVTVRIYTVSFRRIIEAAEYGNFYGRSAVTVASRKLSRLANGTYYVVLAGEGPEGKSVSKPVELIVLR